MGEIGSGTTHQLVGVVTEHAFERGIDLDTAALHVHDRHADPGGCHGQPEVVVSRLVGGNWGHCGYAGFGSESSGCRRDGAVDATRARFHCTMPAWTYPTCSSSSRSTRSCSC